MDVHIYLYHIYIYVYTYMCVYTVYLANLHVLILSYLLMADHRLHLFLLLLGRTFHFLFLIFWSIIDLQYVGFHCTAKQINHTCACGGGLVTKSCLTLGLQQPHGLEPARLLCPWDPCTYIPSF